MSRAAAERLMEAERKAEVLGEENAELKLVLNGRPTIKQLRC